MGDRSAALSGAVANLARDGRMRVVAKSGWHETKPSGGPPGQVDYLNGAVLVETALPPPDVLALLLEMEAKMGRTRRRAWGPRVIDLDLLLYDDEVVQSERLTLPHPRMAWRRFVLAPAAEIAGDMVHPGTGWTVARLLRHLDSAHNYVAISGSIGAGKTRLARHVAEKTGAGMVVEELDARSLKRFYDNPAGTAWEIELEFLEERSRLLASDRQQWSDRRVLSVSDFWFDQSAAFAAVWLNEDDFGRFLQRWAAARSSVVQPKLTVVLSEPKPAGSPGDWLLDRVRRRGREYESRLSGALLHRIEQAVLRRADEPEVGPVLRLSAGDANAAGEEVAAAVEAMQ